MKKTIFLLGLFWILNPMIAFADDFFVIKITRLKDSGLPNRCDVFWTYTNNTNLNITTFAAKIAAKDKDGGMIDLVQVQNQGRIKPGSSVDDQRSINADCKDLGSIKFSRLVGVQENGEWLNGVKEDDFASKITVVSMIEQVKAEK